jgi:non-specific serine/threonine protein kinase
MADDPVTPKARRYDVALSFASEDRQYVERVARELVRAGVAVYYDEYEETTTWGKNLHEHLHYVYSEAAHFTIIFISASYAEKAWPKFELRSALSRALGESREYILPARFDDTDLGGLPKTTGYVDLRRKKPEQLARLVIKKIRESCIELKPNGTARSPSVASRVGEVEAPRAAADSQGSLSGLAPPAAEVDRPMQGRSNLPDRPKRFIGRRKELDSIKQLLKDNRLVTLTGAPGCGKSTLALRVAKEVESEYVDGVRLVELASISDPNLVVQHFATALEVREERGRSVEKALFGFLKSKVILIVLDNCEHLRAECERIVGKLRESCHEARVLATSQDPLGADGESTWRVPGLTLPEELRQGDARPTTISQLMDASEAAQLFIRCVKSLNPDKSLTDDDAPGIAAVCTALDGHPLAIEIAAGWTESWTVDELLPRLKDNVMLAPPDAPARPQEKTLRGLMDRRYKLLSDAERALFRRVAVFQGDWTLPAAETICADTLMKRIQIPVLLDILIRKTLVETRILNRGTRYRMQEWIRKYAVEKLSESADADACQKRHFEWYSQVVADSESDLYGRDQVKRLDLLDLEYANIRAAIDWSSSRFVEGAFRTAGALWRFWLLRCLFSEGLRVLGALLTHPESARSGPKAMTKALLGAAFLAYYQASDRWRDFIAQCEPVVDEVDDAYHEIMVKLVWVLKLADQKNFEQSKSLAKKLEIRARRFSGSWLSGFLSLILGVAAVYREDLRSAVSRFRQGLDQAKKTGDRWLIYHNGSFYGLMMIRRNKLELATPSLRVALEAARDLGDKSGMAWVLEVYAGLAAAEGERARLPGVAKAQFSLAARLLGAVAYLREAATAATVSVWLEGYEILLTHVRQSLGESEFVRQRSIGETMSIDEAVALCLSEF